MTTIIDVAKAANVSKSTVSRVISNNGYVKSETRDRILEVIDKLGYSPNNLARNLRKNKTYTIGFIISRFVRLFGEFIEKFIRIAEEHHYEVIIFCTEGNSQREIDYLNLLKFKEIDALFILTKVNSWNIIKEYAEYGPIATWHRTKVKNIYSSYVDHALIYQDLLTYFKKEKIADLGFILNSKNSENTKAVLRVLNATKKEYWRYFCPEQEGYGEKAALEYLEMKDPPKTLIFYADYVAGIFLHTLQSRGVSKMNIISLDNHILSKFLRITSIDLDIDTQVYNSFSYIYNQLNEGELSERKLNLQIIERKSFVFKNELAKYMNTLHLKKYF
ncbi:LacI family DNA-binding transcriptional regulator [Enterococcus devriesei]|uniref:LacI family DNA-binding transcriptional regulator n=1 Tax=Enterococcus devriesei TaxID=319970 RepID=UPI0036D2C6CB